MDTLVFRLYGPMLSWGEVAVGESRHTASHPGRSALLGLLGAALGIRRDDEDGQLALARSYRFAVKQLSAGLLIRDYHTTQVPDSVGKFRYRTRRDELVIGRERLGTILSSREYRTDSLALVAVRAEDNAVASLNKLVDALRKPHFQLYLGRKSCPLAAPLSPQLIEGVFHWMDAFSEYAMLPILLSGNGVAESRDAVPKRDRYWLSLPSQPTYYWEGDIADLAKPGAEFAPSQVQTLIRHDQPRSRRRWQFNPRQEHLYQPISERTGEGT